MSRIPRPGVVCPSVDAREKGGNVEKGENVENVETGEKENATIDGAPTVAATKLDQTWSPPPARPLATVDTNTKSTKRCVMGDEEQAARNTKQKVDDDSAAPLPFGATLADTTTAAMTAVTTATTAMTTAMTTATTSCAAVPAGELELWQATRQETGWEEKDCLEHKLSLPKKVDAQKKVATLGQHVKRLRALGWTLYGQRNDAVSASSAAKGEAEALAAELEVTKTSLEELSATLGAEVEASRTTISEQTERLKEVTARLEAVDGRLKAAEEEKGALEEEYQRVKDGLERKLQAAETAHAEGQKYTMNLQEYNSKLQKEVQGMCRLARLPLAFRRLTCFPWSHPRLTRVSSASHPRLTHPHKE